VFRSTLNDPGCLLLGGTAAIEFFRKSGLSDERIKVLLQLADVDGDGYLNECEFCAAFHVAIQVMKKGKPFPDTLPWELRQLCTNELVNVPPEQPPEPKAEFEKPSSLGWDLPKERIPQYTKIFKRCHAKQSRLCIR
jgi:hypothetical protein